MKITIISGNFVTYWAYKQSTALSTENCQNLTSEASVRVI